MRTEDYLTIIKNILNEDNRYQTYGSADRICFRSEPMKASFVVEINYLTEFMPAFLIEVVDKETEGDFKQISLVLFNKLVKELNNRLITPFLIGGNGSSYFLKAEGNCSDLSLFTAEEMNLLSSDEWEFNWMMSGNKGMVLNLFDKLKQFNTEFHEFTQARKTKIKTTMDNYLFLPVKTWIYVADDIVRFNLSLINTGMSISLLSSINQYKCVESLQTNSIQRLYREYNDSMRLRWLMSENIFPCAFSLASVHCRGNIQEDASALQEIALLEDWTFDDIDSVFRLLSSDEFCDFIDIAEKRPSMVHANEIHEFNIELSIKDDTWHVCLNRLSHNYQVKVHRGFPFKPDDIQLK